MPDEAGTEATRSDAPSVDDSLFGDALEEKTAADTEAEDSTDQAEQDEKGSDDTGEQDADDKAEQDGQTSDDAAAQVEAPQEAQDPGDSENQDGPSDDLKVVVSIKGGRATIGVQRPSADPHIETFDADDLSGLAQEVPAVTERARARWEDAPKHPAYERPAPPARRRNRRQQGTAEASNAEGEAEQEQQQTLRLF